MSSVVSREKDEKVVSEPKNPVINRALYSGFMFCSKYIANTPMRKLPSMFTLRVPKGRKFPKVESAIWDSKNLDMAPKNPPTPIKRRRFKPIG
jgi:hypothetical protein